MVIEKLTPLNHYALESHPTVYDEESLTALELCAKTAAKMNETIELLLKECKAQNMTISEAYDYLKKNLKSSVVDLVYQFAENGELPILTEENYNAIKSHITTTINVKEYGAKGDGETDDTEAIRAAIDAGLDIYFPAGRYIVTETIVIPAYRHIHGEGANQTVIEHRGYGYLFDVQTVYNNRAIIERMSLVGHDENKCIKCSRGTAWGASMVLRDFNISNFALEVIRFESAYGSVVENGVISSMGAIVYTTFDGTLTETNFCNGNTVRNVYRGSFSENTIPVLYKLFNVRDLTFDRCAMEGATVAIKGESKTHNIVCRGCWFERLANVYDFDSTSKAPYADMCRFVFIDAYNANHNGIDHIAGNDTLYDRNGATSTINSIQSEEVSLQGFGVSNPTDTIGDWFNVYSLTTKGMTCNVPINTKKYSIENESTLSIDLRPILRYSNIGATFRVMVYCRFKDADYKVYSFDILRVANSRFIQTSNPAPMAAVTWNGSVGHTSTETISTTTEGVLTISGSASFANCTAFIETNIHPV